MIILKIVFFCLITIVPKAQLGIGYDTRQTNCKYLYINKNADKIPNKIRAENLYHVNSYQVDLEKNFFKTIEADCFKSDSNNFETHPHDTNYVLYGVDMSHNQLKDHELDKLIKQNSIFKYNFNMIKYLNLSNNNLHLMTSQSSKTYLDNEINSMRDNLNLEPSDPGYLLNRFFSLESLIIDNNPNLGLNFKILISIFPKLKILSLNNCSTNLTRQKDSSKKSRLFYLGLNGNNLDDNFVKLMSDLSIEWLDLSANKITDLKALLDTNLEVKHLSLENNFISLFESSFIRQNLSEINLRYNLIQNLSESRFYSKVENIASLKLFGNPLVCDCNSLWLLKEFTKLKQARLLEPRPNYWLLNRKKSKPDSKFNDSIKMVYRRSLEELSAHLYTFDTESSEYLQRQKRKRFNETIMIRIVDIDQLTCSFLTSSIKDLVDLDSAFFKQVKSNDFNYRIHYREKLISKSKPSDFMCKYEDHCRRDNCDCCDFFHCHCRSICPSKCTCYFDSDMNKNIIDCSSLNLLDIENEQPIELATDVRFNSNSLKVIKSHSFFGFTNVKYLYLQNNQISLLEDECFDDLKNSLKLVNLADNHINYLSGDEFKNFTQLEILILTKNPLKQIDRLDLFSFRYVQNLKLIFMESVNISAENLDFLDKITKLNSNAILRLDERLKKTTIEQTTTTMPLSTITTTATTKSTQSFIQKQKTTRRRPISRGTTIIQSTQITFVNYHENLTNSSTKIEEIYKFKNPFYFLIFILLISIFVLSIILISIVLLKRWTCRDKKNQYLNYVPKLIEQNDYQSDLYSDESESERKKMASIFRCHRKSTSSTDSCDSTYDGQYDSVSIPVSRSIECLNVYVYFNIIDNDYVANHLLPCLKKCATIIPEPKFILKPLKTYCISQADTLSIDWSNESYSSYYSSIYGKKSNNVHAILMVLSENFLGYKHRASESYISIKYKTNPNLYSINSTSGYMSINKSIQECFRKAFKIYLNNGNVWCKISTTTSKKTAKKLQRNSMYLNETNYSFVDSNYSSSAFDNRLVEKLQNYFQYICLKSNFSNFSYVDYTKK